MAFQLEVEYDFDFLVLGISCHEKDYRMCWMLNKALDYGLEWTEDLEIQLSHGAVYFPMYHYQVPEDLTSIYLIKNRVEGGILLPELKQMDYLLKIENNQAEHAKILRTIRKIPHVIGTFDVEVSRLKSKDHLIFE
jgi:hypothetical protein